MNGCAHFRQQTRRVLVHRRIQLDHRARDLRLDAVGDRMVRQLRQ